MSRDALVVGVSAYQYLPSLAAPAQDAEAIAQCLQTTGEFRVTRIPEVVQAGQTKVGTRTLVSLPELEAALVRLFKPKGSNIPQTALFYFSGHGLQKDAGIQEGYLATSDANPQAGFYGLSLFWLRRLLQESPVKQRILLLDCCHSGELLNFLEADPGARAGTDRLFMAASREYESAYESLNGQYSVFTQALLDGLNPERVANGMVTNYALTDWVSNALKSEMQQPLFENSGSEIVLTRCQGASTLIKTELKQGICPYRGLEFFDEIHAGYFFGREDLTDQVIEKLRSRNFVAVVGASGSGKSSLLRAGLIYKLRQGQKFSGSNAWRIQLITPTEEPLKSLARAFVNPKAPAIERAEQLQRTEAFLREGGTGLAHLVRASLMSAQADRPSRLLLIIDQFEEMFTLCHEPHAERDRHRFFNCLLNALQEAGDCLSIVIGLRADFFGKCSRYNGLAEQIEQNLVTVTPLTYEQIKASVVKPAQKVGLTCEPNLVYNILLDVVGAPGELPLLQYTLLELWQRRQADPDGGADRLTLDAYTELGGVRGTLQKRANEVFYSLTLEEQQVAKRVFIALTQLGDGTEDTRRHILKSELVTPRFSAELIDRVLEKLIAAKLVVTSRIAATNRHQEQINQDFAKVAPALRLAQLRRGKGPKQADSEAETILSQLPAPAFDTGRVSITKMARLSADQFSDRTATPTSGMPDHETVDVAHEALIRNWSLLRTWLDENRELLARQRRIEHDAREWSSANQPSSAEYLLHGERLTDAEDYLNAHPDELSAVAQRYVAVSREECRRAHKELRLLQLAVPCTLLVALVVSFNQYGAVMRSKTEKDYQEQVAVSRQRAAIAQSILQDPNGDPTTALLISRLAIEQGDFTQEAEASLRAALQKLRLQANLRGHAGAVHQIAFSPNQPLLATAGDDGTIRLWSLKTQSQQRVLSWGETAQSAGKLPAITGLAFSSDGKRLAAIAQNTNQVRVWSVESGARQAVLKSFNQPVTQLAFSPKAEWLAASDDRSVRLWTSSGQVKTEFEVAEPITSLTFSPDGQWLLIASGNTAQLMETSGHTRKLLTHPKPIQDARFSPDGQFIATGCNDGSVRLWQAQTGHLRHTFAQPRLPLAPQTASIQRVQFSPDSQTLVALAVRRSVQMWNLQAGAQFRPIELTDGTQAVSDQDLAQIRPLAVAFSPDSRQLVTAQPEVGDESLPYVLQIWDRQTGQVLDRFRAHAAAIEAVQYNPDGNTIATASADGSVRLWSADMGSEFPVLDLAQVSTPWVTFRQSRPRRADTDPQLSVSLNPTDLDHPDRPGSVALQVAAPDPASATVASQSGENELVAVAANGSVQQLSLPNSRETPSNRADTAQVDDSLPQRAQALLQRLGNYFMSFRPQSLFSKADATADLARLRAANEVLSNDRNEGRPVGAPPSSPTANTLFQEATAQRIAANLSKQLGPEASLRKLAFSTTTQRIAAADSLGGITVWQVQPDLQVNLVRRLQEPGKRTKVPYGLQVSIEPIDSVRQLAFSPDQQKLLSVGDPDGNGSAARAIRVWELGSGKVLSTFRGHTDIVEQAEFSPDSRLVVSASRDRTAQVWQVDSGEPLLVTHHQDAIHAAHFSPDGRLVVTASQDGTARLWNLKTGAWQVALTGHRGAVLDAEFSPDGRLVVTAGADGTGRLWDARTGIEKTSLRPFSRMGETDPLQRAFFSPDGRFVATIGETGQVHLWTAQWEGLLELARDRSLRQLKPDECLRYLGLAPTACPKLDIAQ